MDSVNILIRARVAAQNVREVIADRFNQMEYYKKKEEELEKVKEEIYTEIKEFVTFHENKTKGMSAFDVFLYNEEHGVTERYKELHAKLKRAHVSSSDFVGDTEVDESKLKSLDLLLNQIIKDLAIANRLIKELNIELNH